jgi:hypothetical protein
MGISTPQKSDPAIADIPVVVLSAIPPASLDGAETVLKKPADLEPSGSGKLKINEPDLRSHSSTAQAGLG